jgi:hypothetical protein
MRCDATLGLVYIPRHKTCRAFRAVRVDGIGHLQTRQRQKQQTALSQGNSKGAVMPLRPFLPVEVRDLTMMDFRLAMKRSARFAWIPPSPLRYHTQLSSVRSRSRSLAGPGHDFSTRQPPFGGSPRVRENRCGTVHAVLEAACWG